MTQASEGIGRTDFISRFGLWSNEQAEAAAAVVRKATEKGIRTVRLSFADQHGVLRGKTVVVDMLESVLRNGISMTTTLLLKDTSHRTVFPIWQASGAPDIPIGASDFVLVPDPTTFVALPWAPGTAWMLGDCYYQSGEPVPFCTRQLCRGQLKRLGEAGFTYLTGLELEFYIFKLINPRLSAQDCGQPSSPPEVTMLAHGYQYLTENRLDQLEPILDELRGTLLELGLPVRTMEVEMGPSQCELTFGPVQGLRSADNVMLARSAIKQACLRRGYHASFMCRPALPNMASSGWHLHQSLIDARTGKNAFAALDEQQLLSPQGAQFVAGLLEHAAAGCLFATPTINGYKRYRPHSLAPNRIVWGRDNRGAMIRVIGGGGDPATHLENRIGESAANPYLYFASQIVSGLDGIQRGLTPPAMVDTPYEPGTKLLPESILEAITALRGSELYARDFGRQFVDYFLRIKDFELRRFLCEEVTDWEQREYFDVF